MPNPLPPNAHILTNINEINSFSNWELVCYIAGISPDTALTTQSLKDAMSRIAIFQQQQNQAAPRLVSNRTFTQQLDVLEDTPANTLDLYVAYLKSHINAGNGEFSIHRMPDMNTLSSGSANMNHLPEMPTLFLDPSVTNEEMTQEKLAEFNSTAMRHYCTQSLGTSEPSENELNAMLSEISSVFSGVNTNNSKASDSKNTTEDEISEDSYSYDSESSYSYESEYSEDEVSDSFEDNPDEKSEDEDSYSYEDEDSYSYESEYSEDEVAESSESSSDDDISESESSEDEVSETHDYSAENELYQKILDLIAATKAYVNENNSENKSEKQEVIEDDMLIDNDEPAAEESLLSRWLNHGIDMKSYDAYRLNGLSLLSQLTGTELNSSSKYEDITQALDKIVVNGKSAKEFFKFQNLDSTLDGVHAIRDNELYMEHLTNKLIDDFTNAIGSVVNGTDINGNHAQKTFILVKDENGVARPLKLNPEDVAHTESNEYVEHPMAPKDRLVSYQEVRDYLFNEAKQKMLQQKNSNGLRYGSFEREDALQRVRGNEYTAAMKKFSAEQREAVENAATYMPEMKNSDLINLYETKYLPMVQKIKETAEYKERFNAIKASIEEANKGRIHDPSRLSPSEAAEKQAIQNCLLSLKDRQNGILMNEIAIEFERRVADKGNIESEINKILESNIKNYEKYQVEKLSMEGGELHESLKEQAKKYNSLVDIYAKKINNESLANGEKYRLEKYAKDKIPNVKFSLDDLSNPDSLMKALREKNIDINDISINGQGLKPLIRETIFSVQANRDRAGADIENRLNSMTEQDIKIMMRSKSFREKLCECFDKMVHPDNYEDMQTMPVIMIKTAAGNMIPEITQGKELKELPKVDEFPDWRKKISRQSTIDANLRDAKAYEDSVLNKLAREADNARIPDINSAIRINAKYAMGKTLTPEEMREANEIRTNVPNMSVQTRSLDNLQQDSATHQPNTQGLTAPVNESTKEADKGMNKD